MKRSRLYCQRHHCLYNSRSSHSIQPKQSFNGEIKYQLSPNEKTDNIWGFSLSQDLHLILELCSNTTLLGNFLLKYFEIFSKDNVDIQLDTSGSSEDDSICQQLNDTS